MSFYYAYACLALNASKLVISVSEFLAFLAFLAFSCAISFACFSAIVWHIAFWYVKYVSCAILFQLYSSLTFFFAFLATLLLNWWSYNKVKIEQSNISEPKEFAYLIKKQSKGYYVVLNVTVENHNQLVEFEQNLKFNSNILRYIIIKDEFYKNNKNKNKEDKIKVEKKEQGEKHD